MQRLLRETDGYKRFVASALSGTLSHAYLLIFDDGKYLPVALKECGLLRLKSFVDPWEKPPDFI